MTTPNAALAAEYLSSIDDPVRHVDESGAPYLTYTGRQVIDAFKAGAALRQPSSVSGADAVIRWVCHNGGLLNEWAAEWRPSGRLTLTAYIESRLRHALSALPLDEVSER